MSNVGGEHPGTVQPTILPSSGSILGLENSTTNADSLGYRKSPPSLLFRRRGLSTCGHSGAQSAFDSMWDNADNAAIPVHFENSLNPLSKPKSEISTDTEQW
ncbi:uncharacterized protein BO88DRAFT_429909 [Aspergillus vadensis CBS 113365]|uniref:Uncharacterized protein n=1 Tax=Aspergillus vadensis (strain CBS 113365 / IMI 142717 / IBT 24658) TaxID=1448311 RepID=A0A319AXE4_ASPVC|nr:hypothetical protein BO88DRAFT_429909 [Aspergillus vadensis CBS 113365]PYH64071.1 hypothetical protein BO88DRAFT_429909 [Aspergillus vadensis CBS 113365]